MRWYAKRLRIDEDGDVADEFLEEVLEDTRSRTEEHHRQYPKFELKYTTKPAKITSLALSTAGKIQHRVEHQGKLEWIWWSYLKMRFDYIIASRCIIFASFSQKDQSLVCEFLFGHSMFFYLCFVGTNLMLASKLSFIKENVVVPRKTFNVYMNIKLLVTKNILFKVCYLKPMKHTPHLTN